MVCYHPKLSRLPCVEAVEGATFDRLFTLPDDNGNPLVIGAGATFSFGVRTRNDVVVLPLSVNLTGVTGQIRVTAAASLTSGRVGRFVWSGTITDGDRVIVLEAAEFYLKEGVLGEVGALPSVPVPPSSSGQGGFETLDPLQYPNFTLTTPVLYPSLARLYIRGIKQQFSVDYVFQSSTYLQWVGVPVTIPNPIFELYS